MKSRLRPLAALLLLAVLNNGIAAPSAAVSDTSPPADAGMAHHGHEGMTDADSGGLPMGGDETDCCQAGDCDCGCTAPQVSAPRMAATPRIPAVSPAVPVPLRTPHVSDTEGAPFRPPA